MSGYLKIGDRSRDGLLEITDTRWDPQRNDVRDRSRTDRYRLLGRRPAGRTNAQARPPRDSIPHPEKTRSARTVRRWSAQGSDHATFAVSRLDDQ